MSLFNFPRAVIANHYVSRLPLFNNQHSLSNKILANQGKIVKRKHEEITLGENALPINQSQDGNTPPPPLVFLGQRPIRCLMSLTLCLLLSSWLCVSMPNAWPISSRFFSCKLSMRSSTELVTIYCK